MLIAVAGNTGVVGAALVQEATRRGHDVRGLSRASGVDVVTGRGLTQALQDVDCVIDVLSTPAQGAAASTRFFEASTRNLLAAETRAPGAHHVALSIVGVDRAPVGYYAGKYAQERLVTQATVPWTIQRATQFHEFAAQMFARASFGPLHLAVKMRTRPIAAREVAVRLIDHAEAGPRGFANDLAGPQEESLVHMMRAWAVHLGIRSWMPPIGLPGDFGRAMRDGRMLPEPGRATDYGIERFDEWVQRQPVPDVGRARTK